MRTNARQMSVENQEPESRNIDKTPIDNSPLSLIFNRVVQYFTTGNLVLKIGIVVLFFGIAFLLKHVVQHRIFVIPMLNLKL